MRSFAAFFGCAALVPAASLAQLPNMPQTAEEKQFYSAVARAVAQIMPLERGRFGLTLADRAQPVFPSETVNNVREARCERVATFGFLGYATELGQITAAACDKGAEVRELAMGARSGLSATLGTLGAKEADARKLGWYYERQSLADGAEFFYFPVLLIGHGVVGPSSVVVYDKKAGKAVVVQAGVRQMCGEGFAQEFKDAPFCTDLREALKRIALALRGA